MEVIKFIIEILDSLMLMSFCAVWFYNLKVLREVHSERMDEMQKEIDLLKPENN